MLNANNTVNYEINVKRKEKKYSWSTVFSWLYLKTIGRILPKKWNKWAENILYYNTTTGSDETHTDKTTDESAQIEPEVAVKESQSEIVSEDEKVQANKVIFQDIAMTDGLTTVDESAQIEPEVAEKGSQSEIISKDGEVQTNKDEATFQDTTMQTECVETTDKNIDQAQQIADLQSENGLLEVKIGELRSIIIGLKADLQSKNSSLKKENRELQSIIERIKKDYRELVEVTDKQEKEFLVKLKAKSEMIECQGRELTELRAEFTDKINELLERVGEVRKNSLINQLQEEQKQVESQLEADIKKLQEEKENMEKQLKIMQQQLLNNQEQQNLEKELKNVDKKLESINKKTKEQTEAKAPNTVSTVSTAKSTTESTLSKLRNLPNKLSRDKGLNNFLSRKNEELKKGFPEFKEKNFLLNFLRGTVKFLSSNQDGKFQGSELLNLFKTNLKQSAKEIIEAKVKEVVNEHCNIGKNVGKELRDGTLKAKLLTSVKQCMKKLGLDVKDAITITDSIMDKICDKENSNKNPSALLKEIVVKELTEARMEIFLEKVKEINLASNVNDTPNSSMSHTNTVSVHLLNAQRVA